MPAPQALLSRSHHADDEQQFLAADLSAIRLVALPEIGPPFDDDPAARASAVSGEAIPAVSVAEAAAAPARKGPGAPGALRGSEAGPDGDWARQFARLLTEALSGARPARQILPWTSERARTQLRALMPLFGGGQRPRVLRVIATRPARDVIEMTVVAGLGERTRALAVRLERAEPPDRPAWLSQATGREQPSPSTPPAHAAGRGKAAATGARWLCTDIEAA
jgi:uncharacterized protein DUF6459